MKGRPTRFYVVSNDTCDAPGCLGRCVAIDILRSNGRRCERHIPEDWLEELEKNAAELLASERSKIIHQSRAQEDVVETMMRDIMKKSIAQQMLGTPTPQEDE